MFAGSEAKAMSEVSNKCCMVFDHGLFLPLALKLSESFERTLYYTPWQKGFPIINDCVVGDGFERIERIDEIWDHLDEIDIAIFPDIQHSGLQLHLQSLGIRTWGSRKGDSLELKRAMFKSKLMEIGLEVGPYRVCKGMTELRAFLKDNEDKYVKISRYRGMMESWHHINYELSEPQLDALACAFGPLQNSVPFIVEDPLETDIEVGYDGFNIDGQWPGVGIQGYEAKDRGLIAAVQDYSDMPKEVTSVNEAIAPLLKGFQYRNFFSSEIRVKDDLSYFIDPTCRCPSPCIEIQLEIWSNLAEFIWHGANGDLVDPIPTAKFGVECMIDHKGDEEAWRTLQVPKEAEQWVKLYACCKKDDLICIPPFPHSCNSIGALVGTGNTLEEAIDNLKATAELLKDQNVSIDVSSLFDTLKEIKTAEEAGIEFSKEETPEPTVALELS